MREWTRDVRGMLQRARESGNRERRRVRSFRFLWFIMCGKRLGERERERTKARCSHPSSSHQRVSPLLLFLFVRLSFKKKIFFACSHLQPSSSSSSLFARTFVSSRIN